MRVEDGAVLFSTLTYYLLPLFYPLTLLNRLVFRRVTGRGKKPHFYPMERLSARSSAVDALKAIKGWRKKKRLSFSTYRSS